MVQTGIKGPMRVVITYGDFDLLDQSHIAFLRQAARLGSALIVGCASQSYAASCGRRCMQSYETRRALLESCRYVSRVIEETTALQKRTDIVNYNAGLLVMGTTDRGRFAHLEDIVQVLHLPDVARDTAYQGIVFTDQSMRLG